MQWSVTGYPCCSMIAHRWGRYENEEFGSLQERLWKPKFLNLRYDWAVRRRCGKAKDQIVEADSDWVVSSVVTKYCVRVSSCDGQTWTIRRRYSDFSHLHQHLCTQFHPNISEAAFWKKNGGQTTLPAPPPKRPFANSDRLFIEGRRRALDSYLSALLSHQVFGSMPEMFLFLCPFHDNEELPDDVFTSYAESRTPERRPSVDNLKTSKRSRSDSNLTRHLMASSEKEVTNGFLIDEVRETINRVVDSEGRPRCWKMAIVILMFTRELEPKSSVSRRTSLPRGCKVIPCNKWYSSSAAAFRGIRNHRY